MSDAEIRPPADYFDEIGSLRDFLAVISNWYRKWNIDERKFLSEIWFRGHGGVYPNPLRPGVYRDEFTKRAKVFKFGKDVEEKRLNVEQRMLAEFRASGAILFDANNIIDVYFTAQHFGMPTSLLDWSTNPLAGLFFAVENLKNTEDGELFVMEAKGILSKVAKGVAGDDGLWDVVSMRHPYLKDAIGQSFWHRSEKIRPAVIIPVRPDNLSGRIGQQSSCFTMHMHRSDSMENQTLAKIKIRADAKASILNELHQMNINQFTIYNDLDHLSKDIKRAWEIQ